MILLNYSKALLALMVWREASGEPEDGQRAVMHVVRNRVNAGWGDWIKVITGKNQFTSMSVPSDPLTIKYPWCSDPILHNILDIVDGVVDGTDEDITKGSLYYYNPATATSEWFQTNVVDKLELKVQIGKHNFYGPK